MIDVILWLRLHAELVQQGEELRPVVGAVIGDVNEDLPQRSGVIPGIS
jgi:hypothetical protein